MAFQFERVWTCIGAVRALIGTFAWNKQKNKCHSWEKFLFVRKLGRKFYYFMAKFQGSGFSFQSLNQNIKVVVFPSKFWIQNFKVVVFPSNYWIQFFKVVVFPLNFWNITIIWQILKEILNFSQKCYYLKCNDNVSVLSQVKLKLSQVS